MLTKGGKQSAKQFSCDKEIVVICAACLWSLCIVLGIIESFIEGFQNPIINKLNTEHVC